ncbi:MAG: serine/threonine protein kinase [Planctomycetota bacterium]|jgi:FixJ family two-component response regulator
MKETTCVLVVDDELSTRLLLSDILKDMGIGEIRVASRGEEAIQTLMREKVDIMLLDLRMPGMDGYEVARRALQVWPNLLIIVVTGYATVEAAVELMKGGIFDILRKPFRYEELREKIDKSLKELVRRERERREKQSIRNFGRYTILSELSRGGMGVVYKAKESDVDRVVALKILGTKFTQQDQVARFYLEGDTISKLDHPGIVKIFDMGICEGNHFIAMEYIEGVSLYDLIYSDKLSLPESIQLLANTLDAIDYAHQQGVIHRDLKPSNILVDKKGAAHIIDFGLAKSLKGRIKITQTDLILGTFGYLAPERLTGDSVDHRADIYSMGAILYEMLTRRLPYEKEDDIHVFPVFVDGAKLPTEIDPKIHPDIEAICMKAIAVQKVDRFPSAVEFAKALREYLAGAESRGDGKTKEG